MCASNNEKHCKMPSQGNSSSYLVHMIESITFLSTLNVETKNKNILTFLLMRYEEIPEMASFYFGTTTTPIK